VLRHRAAERKELVEVFPPQPPASPADGRTNLKEGPDAILPHASSIRPAADTQRHLVRKNGMPLQSSEAWIAMAAQAGSLS